MLLKLTVSYDKLMTILCQSLVVIPNLVNKKGRRGWGVGIRGEGKSSPVIRLTSPRRRGV